MAKRATLAKAIGRILRRTRGQSMAEYSILTFFLFFGGAGSILFVWPTFLNAWNTYIHSYYWILNFPFP